MLTRSIIGRFLILAVLLVSLGVIAQAALIISKEPGKTAAKDDAGPARAVAALAVTPAQAAPVASLPAPAPAPAPDATAGAGTDATSVRVVYPGPLGDAPIQLRKIADAAPASPIPDQPSGLKPVGPKLAPAPSSTAPVSTAVATQPVVVASTAPDAQPTTDPGAPGRGGVNLNSASVEELNHVGGGHIGQTIVQHRPYRSVEDLMKKRVVRRSVYDQIKNQVAAE